MNTILMLVRREFWEQRASFLYVPLCVLILGTVLIMVSVIKLDGSSFNSNFDGNFDFPNSEQNESDNRRPIDPNPFLMPGGIEEFAEAPIEIREGLISRFITSIDIFFGMVLWLALMSYFMNTLYQDRKDRSILFWKSMPVSDSVTIGSKFLAGFILAPAIYLVCAMLFHLFMLCTATILSLGTPIDIWSTLWSPANLFSHWLQMIGSWFLIVFWALPGFAWLIFISSWAKSAPLAWALGIPAAIMFAERVLAGSSVVSDFITGHATPIGIQRFGGPRVIDSFSSISSMELIISTLVGLTLIYGAIFMRARADEL